MPETERVNAVDMHAHAMPLPLLRELEERDLADLSGLDKEVVRLDPRICGLRAGSPIPFPLEQHDVVARLESMAEQDVEVQVVSAPPYLFAAQAEDSAFALDVIRRSNDALAQYVGEAPHRLAALGTAPVGRRSAADEVVRCLDSLGCVGVTIGSSGGGRELDDPINDDLWALLAERGVPVFLHPSGTSSPDRHASFHLVQLLGYPADTALAVGRLILGGVMEKHPLALYLAHGGGCIWSVAGRLDVGWERKSVAHTTEKPPSDVLRRLYYDTAVFDPEQLRYLVAQVGSDRVLLGSDFPFDLADRTPRASVEALDLSPKQTADILSGNAYRLIPSLPRAVAGPPPA